LQLIFSLVNDEIHLATINVLCLTGCELFAADFIHRISQINKE